MSTEGERLSQRLRELPSDVLAEVLVRQTKGNPRLRQKLVDLTSSEQEKASGVVRTLAGIRRAKPVRDELEISKLVGKLIGVLDAIRSVADTSAPRAFELICEFIALDTIIFSSVGNTAHMLEYSFNEDAPRLAAHIALGYNDSDHTCMCLMPLLEEDPIGARCSLIQHLHLAVPESVMRAALDFVDERLQMRSASTSLDRADLFYVKRVILIGLCDTDGFIAWCTHAGVLDATDTLALVQMYVDRKEYDLAQRWLSTLKANMNLFSERHRLQVAINTGCGRETPISSYYSERFLAQPNAMTYAPLARHLSATELEGIHDDLQMQVANAPKLLASSLKVLIIAGRGKAAEDMVAKRNTMNDADCRWPLIAKSFEDANLPFGACVAYRLALDNILERRNKAQYYNAATYYASMWELALKVTDWRGLSDHSAYIADIFERYADRKNFWLSAEYTLTPPTVSRFTLPLKQRHKFR